MRRHRLSRPSLVESLEARTLWSINPCMPRLAPPPAVPILPPTVTVPTTPPVTQTPVAVAATYFDPHYYGAWNADVVAAVNRGAFADLYAHYLAYGQAEGRHPNAYFDPAVYLSANPDVAAAVANGQFRSGYDHFVRYGYHEHRTVSTTFNDDQYLATHSAAAAAVTRGEYTCGMDYLVRTGGQTASDVTEDLFAVDGVDSSLLLPKHPAQIGTFPGDADYTYYNWLEGDPNGDFKIDGADLPALLKQYLAHRSG